MEMLISQDWLQRRIDTDPSIDTDAGTPVDVLVSLGMFIAPELVANEVASHERASYSFGVFIRQLRRRDGLSVEKLAQKARIDVEELRLVEHDPHYRAKPRMVHQLSEVFKIPERSMMTLAGAMVANDNRIEQAAERFAAMSDDMSKLTREERRLLNDFVKFLADETR
jgi:transcriptional regulator with XRE-family HTH domain